MQCGNSLKESVQNHSVKTKPDAAGVSAASYACGALSEAGRGVEFAPVACWQRQRPAGLSARAAARLTASPRLRPVSGARLIIPAPRYASCWPRAPHKGNLSGIIRAEPPPGSLRPTAASAPGHERASAPSRHTSAVLPYFVVTGSCPN